MISVGVACDSMVSKTSAGVTRIENNKRRSNQSDEKGRDGWRELRSGGCGGSSRRKVPQRRTELLHGVGPELSLRTWLPYLPQLL
ncbi:hypothetical protein Q7C36_002680 [Tachysurus vachellii]|uniref:Uncharacterized protein n=1 Tax=Tachysurus vachellii TaxID=175792 RepID=A0AA88NYK5_TACVA|nr:hypothetical protein Q7C36_002680 [Tachysurus vachellii]